MKQKRATGYIVRATREKGGVVGWLCIDREWEPFSRKNYDYFYTTDLMHRPHLFDNLEDAYKFKEYSYQDYPKMNEYNITVDPYEE